MFRGSALTFGTVEAYWGSAPFQRYTLQNTRSAITPTSARTFSTRRAALTQTPFVTGSIGLTLDQDRTANYQAIFFEDLIRIGKFHIVPSFRLDHENVQVDLVRRSLVEPPLAANAARIGPDSISADHWIPLWGIGLGTTSGI